MSSVNVISPGLFTTVQDFGRSGWQRFGVPVAGVFDRFAASVANWLVGNAANTAVLEISYLGPTLTTTTRLQAAIAGSLVATLDGEQIACYQTFDWLPGQTLAIGGMTAGARAYLAIASGWQVPLLMDSRSTYVRAALGGHLGRQLQAGDQLPVLAAADPSAALAVPAAGRRLPRAFWPALTQTVRLRYLPGPQADHFSAAALECFQNSSYQVAPASDRMGIRLQGAAVIPEIPDIVSDAIVLGSIQVPKDGQPIIMGPDHQTTGGYPKIGTVLSPDMDKLAQLRPGATIAWQAVTIEQAREIFLDRNSFQQAVKQVIWGERTGKSYRVRLAGEDYYSFLER